MHKFDAYKHCAASQETERAAADPGKLWGKKQRKRRGVIKEETRSHMGGRISNESPCSKTSPTKILNLLSLSLAEMQLIRIDCAQRAEVE